MTEYTMTVVEEIPRSHAGRKTRPHVDRLRNFLDSGHKAVQINGVPAGETRRVYNGLLQAGRRPEFKGLVAVKRNGEQVFLIRL